jgi:hypothetical protein
VVRIVIAKYHGSMKMRVKQLLERPKATVLISFQVLGFKDYSAARVLINAGKLLEGAALASTAVEKFIKVLLGSRRMEMRGHLEEGGVDEIMQSLALPELNGDFLRLLARAYRLRYLDDLKGEEISLGIERRKFLAELDFTVDALCNSFGSDDGALNQTYCAHAQMRTPELVLNNYLLEGLEKTQFVQRPDLAIAAVITPELTFIEHSHDDWSALNDGLYMRPAIVRCPPTRAAPDGGHDPVFFKLPNGKRHARE